MYSLQLEMILAVLIGPLNLAGLTLLFMQLQRATSQIELLDFRVEDLRSDIFPLAHRLPPIGRAAARGILMELQWPPHTSPQSAPSESPKE